MADPFFDLVVIGAGPGGYVAAMRAAELGMKVACVDKQWLGGTCLNIGCIPSKALLESTERYHEVTSAYADHGIAATDVSLDVSAMMARKQRIVDTMTKGISGLFSKHKVEFFSGLASVPESGRVVIDDANGGLSLSSERILLATGSVPAELKSLPFDGRHVISSTEALELSAPPGRLVVIGAGAIGLEMGSVWSRLGSDVLVIEFMDGILPGADREIASQLQRVLTRQGMNFELGTTAESADVDGDEVTLTVISSRGERRVVICDRVLVAIGRRPYHAGTGIDKLSVVVDEGGFVTVDDNYQTSVPGLYAIGDAIPGPMLAHKAEVEGVTAVERMSGIAGSVNYDTIPTVVYTHPEVACVGKTEEELKQEGASIKVGKRSFRANARAYCMDAVDGLVKILADADNDRLLGMHILGPQASHLISEGVLAMEFAASAEDIARTVHAHPSLSEVIKEAAWEVA